MITAQGTVLTFALTEEGWMRIYSRALSHFASRHFRVGKLKRNDKVNGMSQISLKGACLRGRGVLHGPQLRQDHG